jgi:hypothetical protein
VGRTSIGFIKFGKDKGEAGIENDKLANLGVLKVLRD